MSSPGRSKRGRRSVWVAAGAGIFITVITLAPRRLEAAEKNLDRAGEKWLREVHLLILPEEEALFRTLATAEDRREFQRIFWARRDPDPSTARNEMEEALVKGRARADDLFTSPNTRGVETGCGQVFLLLGDPLEVQGTDLRLTQGRGAREKFDSLQPMRDGARPPEVWVYRSKAGDAVSFTGGELRIAFDDACRFSEGGRILDDLRLVARSRVVRPALDYRKGAEGHLVPLDALVKAQGASSSAPLTGASDFPVALEPKLLLRTQAGVGYAAGLVRADLAAANFAKAEGPLAGVVSAEATPASGPAVRAQRAFSATVAPDGSLLASYGLTLKPGQYTLRVAVSLSDGKSASATAPLEVPDFEAPGLRTTPLILYPDEPATPPDPRDPYSALSVGSLRLRPRFGDGFRATDALQVVAVVSGGQTDPATGKASLHARFSILKDGKAVARGEEQAFDTATAVASIGPVPLKGFAAGRYAVRLEAKDAVSGKSTTDERPFELKE
jgi:GWxTD domain-containing protein